MGRCQYWFYWVMWLSYLVVGQELGAMETKSGASTNFTYYPVQGNSERELRESMNEALKGKPFSEKHDATTQWSIKWSYHYSGPDSKLRITDFNVSSQATIRLPQWKPPPEASPALIKRWQEFVNALARHEYKHAEHGQLAAQDMLNRVKALDTFSSANGLRSALQEINDNVLSKYRQADADYDRETQHGVKQGAHFP